MTTLHQIKRLVILISGSGSNLQAIIDAIPAYGIPAQICAVISNRVDAFGLTRARQAGIPTDILDHKQFSSREAFDEALSEKIDAYQPDYVILAGFMRILTEGFVTRYSGRMINIHPSLLPKFQGLHTHRRAIEAAEQEHGATVHFVTPELDGGPCILKAKVTISDSESETSLAEKVLQQEHIIYPTVINWLARDILSMSTEGAALGGSVVAPEGLYLNEISDTLRLHP